MTDAYFKLRISLDNPCDCAEPCDHTDPVVSYDRVLKLILKLISEKNLKYYTGGFETLNGYGEPVTPHFHFHFRFTTCNSDPKRTIGEYIKKSALTYFQMTIKGTKRWCLQLVEEPDDEERFFRYPFKISPISRLINFPTNITDHEAQQRHLHEQVALAQDEQKRRVLANCIARERTRDRVTFKDRLFKYLDDTFMLLSDPDPLHIPAHKYIWLAVLQYYQQEDKPINFETIRGYTKLYQLQKRWITPDSAYDSQYNTSQYNL